MFTPKVTKPQTRATEDQTSRSALERSTLAGRGFGYEPIGQPLFLQRTNGNQATLRILAQRASRPDREIGLENIAIRRCISRDFSKIPVFSPERESQSQPSFSPPAARFAGAIQTKLVAGSVNDPLPAEADRVADRNMKMPDSGFSTAGATPQVSRKYAAREEEDETKIQKKREGQALGESVASSAMHQCKCACSGSGQKCNACRAEEDGAVQRKATSGGSAVLARPVVHRVLRQGGQPETMVRNPLAHLHGTIGNQAVRKLLRQIETESAHFSGVRGNLEIRPPGDSLESDADRMTDKVLRMSDSPEFHKSGANPAGANQQSSGGSVLPSSGEPLSDSLREHYEPRFWHDFSRVRVHAGAQAAQSARALGAKAYTAGRDIVFGGGQFAPETGEGKNLLAHELAHVVQQDRGQVGPSIQRRLIIKGGANDADIALRLLEAGSGLTLQRDKKTGQVSVRAQSPHPHSPALEKELLTIIINPKQDAEIHVMQKKDPPGSNIEFGEFPLDATDYDAGVGTALVQQVRIDEVAALEKGVPGAGAYTLAHEIWENFSAHTATELATDKKLKGQKRAEMHERVHPLAEAQANLVAGELIGPGERVALFQVPIEVGKPPKLILRHVEDRRQYFLVWDTTFESATPVNVHKADRIQVSKYTLPGPDPDIIAKIVEDMKKNPTATAHFEGFAGGKKSPRENQQAALANVNIIEEIVFQKADEHDVVSHYRFFEDGNSTTNKDSVVVTIERPGK